MEVQDGANAGHDAIHLSPSLRAKMTEVCAKEGETLEQFVQVAIADRLERHAEMEWLKRRKPATPEDILRVRRLLRRAGGNPPDPGDELPEGWVYPELP